VTPPALIMVRRRLYFLRASKRCPLNLYSCLNSRGWNEHLVPLLLLAPTGLFPRRLVGMNVMTCLNGCGRTPFSPFPGESSPAGRCFTLAFPLSFSFFSTRQTFQPLAAFLASTGEIFCFLCSCFSRLPRGVKQSLLLWSEHNLFPECSVFRFVITFRGGSLLFCSRSSVRPC